MIFALSQQNTYFQKPGCFKSQKLWSQPEMGMCVSSYIKQSVWNSVIYMVLESSNFLYFLLFKKNETSEAE